MVFWIQEKNEQFGKSLACCMGFFSPAERMGKGAIQNTTHWRVLAGTTILSIIKLFRSCVEEISRRFPDFWRTGRSQESFNCQL